MISGFFWNRRSYIDGKSPTMGIAPKQQTCKYWSYSDIYSMTDQGNPIAQRKRCRCPRRKPDVQEDSNNEKWAERGKMKSENSERQKEVRETPMNYNRGCLIDEKFPKAIRINVTILLIVAAMKHQSPCRRTEPSKIWPNTPRHRKKRISLATSKTLCKSRSDIMIIFPHGTLKKPPTCGHLISKCHEFLPKNFEKLQKSSLTSISRFMTQSMIRPASRRTAFLLNACV